MSRTTGAVVDEYEIFPPAEAVRQAMGRDPDFAESWITSWGNVEIAEVERVMRHNEDPYMEDVKMLSQWSEWYKSDEYFWSLYIPDKEPGEEEE